jgi:MFS family permease
VKSYNISTEPKVLLLFFIFLAGLVFYAYEFFLRLLPGAYPDQIMQYFEIDKFQFSFLISSYNITYLLMQIPAGILLDHFGNRRVILSAIAICGLGNIIFISPDYSYSVLGRLCVGFGSAFAFVAVLKLSREYLPQKYFATFASIAIALGTLGGAFSQQIANLIISNDIWQEVFIYSGFLAIPLMIFIWLVLFTNRKIGTSDYMLPPTTTVMVQVWHFIKDIRIWINALMGGLLYAPTVVLTAQWGVYYLTHSFGLSRDEALMGVTILLLGWVVFSPLISMFADTKNMTSKIIYPFAILSLLTLWLLVYFNFGSVYTIMILLFLFGSFSAAQVLVWRNFNKLCPNGFSGTGVAITNMMLMLFVELVQLFCGYMLTESSVSSANEFKIVILIISLCVIMGMVMQYIFHKLTKPHRV